MTASLLPEYFLYGEPQQFVRPDFIHLESLDHRSRPGNWTIHPHLHDELNQLLLITRGGGTIRYEAATIEFTAPRLLVVPRRMVHGFEWHSESRGQVLSIAELALDQLVRRHPEIGQIFVQARCMRLEEADSGRIGDMMQSLGAELTRFGPGHSAAVEAALLQILVAGLRILSSGTEAPPGEPRRAGLVARYHELIEQRFRLREAVGDYARMLAVSATTLREACAETGQSPAEIRDRRTILEAQRMLAFSELPVAAVAESVGFEDSAYFSRFFSRHCGQSPGAWRRAMKRNAEGVGPGKDLFPP